MPGPDTKTTAKPAGRSGGRILVDNLVLHGADTIFCVPGESYLDVLDALYDARTVKVVVCKHEGAAANMAEADAKLTGRPGICFVTRGPGATQASVGVHTAMHDSTPMILFIGQVDRSVREREAFQEVDFKQMFSPLAKWVAEIDRADRIPEYVARAFQTATSGRPGPVVLSLPEDVLADVAHVVDPDLVRRPQSAPLASDMAALREELARAQRPLVVLGGSGWTSDSCGYVKGFVEANGLPVAASFRRQDLLDNTNDHYVGHLSLGMDPKLAESVRAADLLIAIGSRLGDVTTGGYKLLTSPRPKQRLVHVHPDPEELGRVFQPDVAIIAGLEAFAAALPTLPPVRNPPWLAWRAQLRQNLIDFAEPPRPASEHRGVHLATVIRGLADRLSADAIVTNGAGNYTVWVHRFYRYRHCRTELAPTSGSMGYGFPAAIAAKLRYPERTVVCFAGDGCFLMYPQELATAVQFGAAVVVIVVNNGMYGTIRMHQERRFPGRVSATDLVSPDFVALAQSFGAYAERVDRTEDFAGAFERAEGARVPALLELRVDPDQITPNARLASRSQPAQPRATSAE
jgi:acetolactate synthase I/II/III large subunit